MCFSKKVGTWVLSQQPFPFTMLIFTMLNARCSLPIYHPLWAIISILFES